jgi:putative Holliday junction resolvase
MGACRREAVRAIGVDVGEQRIGVAWSESGLLATPYDTLRRTPRAARDLAQLATGLGAEVIVVGLPLKMRGGGEGNQAALVRAFAAELAEQTAVPIEFYDERLTTAMAERTLIESGLKRDKRKAQIDAVAASIILQGWLDRRRLAAAPVADA